MKIADYKRLQKAKDGFSKIIASTNATSTSYPEEKTIQSIFEENVARNPDHIAIIWRDDAGKRHERTYKEVDQLANCIARLLQNKGIGEEDVVGLLLNSAKHTIPALIGILKSGAAYVALNEAFPIERKRYILEDTGAKAILSEKKFLKELNNLQWECSLLHTIVCLDSDNIYAEKEAPNELMNKNLWDYTGEQAADDIAAGGWVNSYTGADLSRDIMDEYGDNILKKLMPVLKPTDKVLEIGCSSGISMFRLAPLVAEYHGTDLSDEILKKTEQERVNRGLDNIKLYTAAAHEIENIGVENFDAIIINSVIQCFEGMHYLREVLSKAIRLLGDEGFIFVGDIMDLDKKQLYLKSLRDFKKEHAGEGFVTKVDWSNEMFFSRHFFDDLGHEIPSIEKVTHSEKIYTIPNELTEYRYDTLLKINKKNNKLKEETSTQKLKYQIDRSALKRYREGEVKQYGNGRSLAYIVYTSGTTGNPKGVLIEHRSVSRLVINTNYIQITPQDKLVKTAPLSFDAATFEVWGALLNGASLFIADKDTLLDATSFGDQLAQEKITICWLTSSLFNRIVEQKPEIFRPLKTLLVGGAALSPQHVQKVLELHEKLEIINGYGPTENTTFSTTFSINKAYEKSIPIGKPIANSQCYILNDKKEQVPLGVNGNLYVAGDGLARGYLNSPELTAEKFIDNPFHKGKKMYNTGDIAKWMPDGNIRFIGRNDNQIKMRGFRIELEEIQEKIKEIIGENNILVTTGKEDTGELYLCAYIASSQSYDVEGIKKDLQDHLPAYMIPSYMVNIEHFPLNANGKIDIKALPDPKEKLYRTKEALIAPRDIIEESLLEIWKEVLELDHIGISENFFAIGGHSLKATQVVSKVQKALNFDIGIREIFNYPTIASLGLHLQKKNKVAFSKIPKSEEKEYYELSPAQKRLWVLNQFEEEKLAYSMPGMFTVKGLNKDVFEKVLLKLIQRHESLRTVFLTVDNEPVQKVLDIQSLGFKLGYHNLEGMADQQTMINELATEDATTDFDLSNGPLLRVTLLKLKEKEYILLFNKHHIISDGWSMKVMVNELFELYHAYLNNRPDRLEPLRIQYKDYSEWHKQQLSGESLKKHKSYWLGQMSKPLPILAMPTDAVRPTFRTSSGGSETKIFNVDLREQLYEFSEKQGVTPFMTFLAIAKALFYHYTGQKDIIIGTPIAGREHEDLENQIGLFVNTLVLRTQFDNNESFNELLAKVRNNTLDAYEHQIYPFDQLVEDLSLPRDMSRNPVYDVMLTFQNTGLENVLEQSNNELSITPNDNGIIMAKVDLCFTFQETNQGLALTIEYNTDLFSQTRIVRMLNHFETLTKAVLVQEANTIDELVYLPTYEKEKILQLGAPKQQPVPEYGLLQFLKKQSSIYPDKAAVICNGVSLSYQELEQQSDKLAYHLSRVYGVGPNDFVAIAMDRSIHVLSVIMAVFKTGAAYLPVDTEFPIERLSYMLQDCKVKAVIAEQTTVDKMEFWTGRLLQVEQLLMESAPDIDKLQKYDYDPQRLAYAIYTSGSTGQPKGVAISHGALTNFLVSMQHQPGIDKDGLMLALTTFSFDISILEICLPLLTGATVLLADNKTAKDPDLLIELMKKYKPTMMQATPGLWKALLDNGWEGDLSLKALCGGEALPRNLGIQLLQKTRELWNMYGPTETTIWSLIKHVVDENDLDSIGKPINNTEIYVLNGHNQLVPKGVEGELHIGGQGLSLGYLNKPELTNKQFIENPFQPKSLIYKTGDLVRWLDNGEIKFIGRKDNQVKINGYRVELGEIDKVLNEHKAVRQALTHIFDTTQDSKQLVAYLVMEHEVDEILLRDYLYTRLPHYMMPHHFVIMDELPMTANGKLNRKALPIPGQKDNIYVAPESNTEMLLAEAWEQLLKSPKVGVNDNFFSLGGHSLKAVQLVSWIHQKLGVKLQLKDIFTNPTVNMLANAVDGFDKVAYKSIPRVPVAEHYPLSHSQKRLWILDKMQSVQLAYNMPGAFRLEDRLDREALEYAVEQLVKRHESLRTTFVEIDEEPRQIIHKSDEWAFKVKFTDLSSSEHPENQAERLANTETRIVFDLEKGPLFRVNVLQISEKQHLILFTIHHIISDGWSMGILIKETLQLYNARLKGVVVELPPLRIQYKDYTSWQNQILDNSAHESYWLDKLSGDLEILRLPYDFKPGDSFSYEGSRKSREFDKQLSDKLKELSQENNTSLSNVIFTIFNILLYNITGQKDILIGTAIANRNHIDVENIVGLFVNSLVIRNKISDEQSFIKLLAQITHNMVEAFDHQDYPIDLLVQKICPDRINNIQPIFNVFYGFQNFADVVTQADDYEATMQGNKDAQLDWFEQDFATAKFDLTLFVHQIGDGLKLTFEYNSDLFTEESITKYLYYFEKIAVAINEKPALAPE
jgi:amino acid adenylation domain-containing protein